MMGILDFICNTLCQRDCICMDHKMDEFDSTDNIFYFQVYINMHCNLDEKNFRCSILFDQDINYKYRKKDELYFLCNRIQILVC